MNWKKLKRQYSIICEKAKLNKDYSKEWKEFKKLASIEAKNPSPAVSAIHNALKKIEKLKKRDKIYIFDHGCGSGLKVVYLAALGYTNIHGVNVNDDVDHINKILLNNFKINKKKFYTTDGKKVPFKDKFFDFIISSQVVEHLREDEVYFYYEEEGRVLKKNGLAYHEVPHKFMPYESHSRLWLIHLFPYVFKPILYGIFLSLQARKNLILKGSFYANHFSKEFLILRSPNFHKNMLVKNIGSYQDLTEKRLLKENNFSSYDNDSPIRLRKLIQYIFMLPIIGKLFVMIFKNFFILQTLSRKNHD